MEVSMVPGAVEATQIGMASVMAWTLGTNEATCGGPDLTAFGNYRSREHQHRHSSYRATDPDIPPLCLRLFRSASLYRAWTILPLSPIIYFLTILTSYCQALQGRPVVSSPHLGQAAPGRCVCVLLPPRPQEIIIIYVSATIVKAKPIHYIF